MEIKTIARRWGNSIAVIIPKELVDERGIKENQEIQIEIKQPLLAKEVFGILRKWKRPTQEIKDEMKKGWK